GPAVLVERGGDADEDRIRLPEAGEVRGGQEALPDLPEHLGGDRLDVGFALPKLLDLGGVDVEAHDPEALLGEEAHEGKADVAQADHADHGLLGLDELLDGRDRPGLRGDDGHAVFSTLLSTASMASMWPFSTVRDG